MFSVIAVALLVNSVYSQDLRVDPLVSIEQGLVKGLKSADGLYSSFLGIPYAQVDLENPFGVAKPSPRFDEEIFEAFDAVIECPQAMPMGRSISGHETLDCLTLNIYVPNSASSRNPLPVFVWIHGGGFSGGSAGFEGVPNLVRHDIVVVKINYRLGPYGFLCLDTSTVPGNQGLKDQHEALRWVRNNIAAFGGNPYDVTIGGQSAGSCSAILHLYSNTEKLFNKIIAESGVPQVDGMFSHSYVEAAFKLASYLGFNTSDTAEALDFLSKTSPELVATAFHNSDFRLMPCKEKSFSGVESFIVSDPYKLSNEKKIRNTPILIGHTNKEQSMNYETVTDISHIYYNKIKNNFDLNDETINKVADIIKHFYSGDKTESENISIYSDRFDSDFTFNHPIQRTITNLLKENASPIYEYLFTYVGDSGKIGAEHSAELRYLFEYDKDNLNEEDWLITDRITKLWANFIKTGNPTPQITDLLPVVWEPISETTRPYLIIDTDIRMENRVFNDRMAFWDLFQSVYENSNYLTSDSNQKV